MDTTDIRTCAICHLAMSEGFYDGEGFTPHEYYCSEQCLSICIPLESWNKLYTEDGESYWTEWESIYFGE